MKYGIRCVDDLGVPGSSNESRWAGEDPERPLSQRFEFDSDAAARAFIREVLLRKENVAAQIKRLKEQNQITIRTAPAKHWVFYAWPLPPVEKTADLTGTAPMTRP